MTNNYWSDPNSEFVSNTFGSSTSVSTSADDFNAVEYTFYPMHLTPGIWVDGVDKLLPIQPEHDLGMLENF